LEWLKYLLILVCPLMMIFCMKGHGHGHKHQNHESHCSKGMDTKISNLEIENAKLRQEIEALASMVKKGS